MFDSIILYSTARGYVQSAYLMMSNVDRYQTSDDTSFYLSFHMLCGFATELYLKSFLAHKGYDEKTLRSARLRHNLLELYKAAVVEGLTDIGAKFLVDLLSEQHQNFEFRYMKPNSEYRTVDIRKVFIAFSSFNVAVDTAVGASVSEGKKPGGQWVFPGEYALWRS